MKATQEEVELIKKITSESYDPTATTELFERYYVFLADTLSRNFSEVDSDTVLEVVFDTLNGFIKSTTKFDPQRGTLAKYLKMDAWRNLQNRLQNYRKEKKSIKFVEDWETHRNIIVETSSSEDEEKVLTLAKDKLKEIFPDPIDFQLAKMVVFEVRETAKYTDLLGIVSIPSEEQKNIVKQHKDRIKKVLERKGWDNFKKSIKQRFL